MTDTNDNALLVTYERRVMEVIVWYADDNVQRIVSAQEFDRHFAGVTPAARDTPPDVAAGKKEADQAAKEDAALASYVRLPPKEDAALASYLRLSPTKKRKSTYRVISAALHVLHSAEKNENGYTGITARRIIDSGLADYVLDSAKDRMIKVCNSLKGLVDAGHATRRVGPAMVRGRLRPVYHYAPAGAPAEAVPVPAKAGTVYHHAPARAWPVTPRMREKTR
jgi:hypothetical protein